MTFCIAICAIMCTYGLSYDYDFIYPQGGITDNNILKGDEQGHIYLQYKDDSHNELLLCGCDPDVTKAVIPDSINNIPIVGLQENAFYERNKDSCLTKLELPNAITELSSNEIFDCWNLVELKLPNNLLRIDSQAISHSGLKSIYIPKNVEYIAGDAFEYCYHLSDIEIDPDNKNYKAVDSHIFSKDGTTMISYGPRNALMSNYNSELSGLYLSYRVPDGVTEIGDRCFWVNELTSLVISDSVTSIGKEAIMGPQLEAIVIPSSVKSMADDSIKIYKNNYPQIKYDCEFESCTEYPTIYCEPGSYAENYAKNKGIPYKNISLWESDSNKYKIVQNISIYKNNYNLLIGDKAFKINAKAKTEINFTSSNENVVKVNDEGLVSIVGAGKARINIIAKKTDCYFEAQNYVDIVVNKNEQDINGIRNYNLKIDNNDFNLNLSALTDLTYESTNEKVLNVDNNGNVKIVGEGQADIVVIAKESSYYKLVKENIHVSVSKYKQIISGKTKFTKTFGVKPFNVNQESKTSLKYTSNNKNVATVSKNGLVTIKNPGTAKIVVKASENSKYKGCTKYVTIKSTLKKPALFTTPGIKRIKITWSKVPGADGYKLYIFNKAKGRWYCRLTKSAKIKGVVNKGLKRDKYYSYKVRAYRYVGNKRVFSPYSNVRRVKTK